MRSWAWMLGGLIVWTVHLFGAYAIASLAVVVAQAVAPAWRAAGMAFSLACLSGAVVIAGIALRRLRKPREESPGFRHEVALLSSLVAMIGIAWQALPFAIGH